MATFPDLKYNQVFDLEYSPDVTHTIYGTKATRQRLVIGDAMMTQSVNLELTSAELATFRTFVDETISGGSETYTGPFIIGNSEFTGELQIVDGKYSVSYAPGDIWEVSYSVDIIDYSDAIDESFYDLVNDFGSFDLMGSVFYWLEIAMNQNIMTVHP